MHNKFLLAALEQAKSGRGLCAPNPCVGAVAVKNGRIIAQAYHQGAGKPHAEQLLLAQFPADTPDISLYVTLEPCNHWGRTPPCVDAIIAHNIKQVIYAYRDPNQLVSKNNTPQLLREKGIDVIHHSLPEIDRFYQSYTWWTRTGTPWVTVKMAHSLDGGIAGALGERMQLSNQSCQILTHQLRADADVILTSARTILQDNPLLNVRVGDTTDARVLAIIDTKLAVNPAAAALLAAKEVHIYHPIERTTQQYPASCHVHKMPYVNNHIDLKAVIQHLGKQGYHHVMVEAGGRIFSTLHALRLVNRTYLYIVPTFLGRSATPLFPEMQALTENHTVTWQMMEDNMVVCLDWLEDSCSPE